MGPYNNKPGRLLANIIEIDKDAGPKAAYCAGFELNAWRCKQLAENLMEWLPDYALKEDELDVHHGNIYFKLKEAAVRVYTSDNYTKRGEVGEILLHAICRDFFNTFPLAPRVFYLSSSNDVVKSFDLVHIKYDEVGDFELWLGEAKLWEDRDDAIRDALRSITTHIDQGFLHREKLLLGPQISKWIPRYEEVRQLFSSRESIDKLFKTAVFPICIASDSESIPVNREICDAYINGVSDEINQIWGRIKQSGLLTRIRILLIYVPLGSKSNLLDEFHKLLKGLSA
jgi:hypothetical protein